MDARLLTRKVPRAVARAFALEVGLRPEQMGPLDPRIAIAIDDNRRDRRLDVDVYEAWVEVPIPKSPWIAAARLVSTDEGLPVIAELRVFPAETLTARPPGEWSATVLGVRAPCPRSGITARLLRAVPLGVLWKAMPTYLRQAARQGEVLRAPDPRLTKELGFAAPSSGRRSRRPVPDVLCAALAAVYVEALKADPRRALRLAAAEARLPYKRMRDIIHQARKRRLLTTAGMKQGKAGGALTSKARDLLADGTYWRPAAAAPTQPSKPRTPKHDQRAR
jgi:hypothetical protein